MIESERSWFQTAKQEGKAEGRIEGRAQGRAEGEIAGVRKTVQTMVEDRYGPLPDWVVARLGQATEVDLLGWARQLLAPDRISLVRLLGQQESNGSDPDAGPDAH